MSEELEDHPIASIFPLLNEAELAELAEDIRARGVQVPIILFEGKILDGRNRYRAAKRVEAHFVVNHYTGDSPTAQVLSLNLKRRQLTASQKAAVAVDALPFFEAEAKRRQIRKPDSVVPILDEQKGRSSKQAAESTGASATYVQDAKNLKQGAPELFEKVRTGEITIPEAKREMEKTSPPKQPLPPVQIAEGLRLWTLAKSNLDKIIPTDLERAIEATKPTPAQPNL